MNDNEKYIEEFLKDIPFHAPDDEYRDKLKKQLLNAFPKHRLQPAVHTVKVWRNIMKSSTTRIAAAAVIIIAVFFGLNLFIDSSGVAWGELVERLEQIKTVAYQMKIKMKGVTGMPEGQTIDIDMEAKCAYGRGIYIDTISHTDDKEEKTKAWVLFDEEVIVSLIPDAKKYIKMKLTGDLLAKMEKESGDPRATLRETMKYKYTELGRDTINGIEVEGIEVTDPAMLSGMFDEIVAQVWVDVETELPVLMAMKGSASNGEVVMDITQDNFQWDVEIDPAELVPDIPEDYELLIETEIGGGKDGKELVELLKSFAYIADGKYPSSLTGMTAVKELVEAIRTKFSGQSSPQELDKDVMASLVKFQMVGMMYSTMVKDGNDPAYYGDKVTAEFPHAVLMRWKMSDDTYRVIFGDLRIGDVSAEELAEFEAVPLNLNPQPIKPEPADGTEGTALTGQTLRWMPGLDAVEHKVYFGTSSDELPLLTTTSGTDFDQVPALKRDTTYYWRVDAVSAGGEVTEGELWSLSTGSLVAWWKLDDGSGDLVVDSGPNHIDGATLGDPSWTDGVLGGALQFDGDGDYIDLGNNTDFDLTGQITFSAWIKVDAFDKDWQTIIAKGDSSWRLQRNQGNDALEFSCTGLPVPGSNFGSIYGKTNVNDGQWHHALGTYDGSRISLYVDGRQDVSADVKGSIKTNGQSVYIGENSEKPGRFWNGLIDDVRIYSYALSADEVTALASSK